MRTYLVLQIASLAFLTGLTVNGCVARKAVMAGGGAAGAVLMLGSIFLQLTHY